MVFFGWGRKSKTHQVGPEQALVLSFGYFHLFWLFRVTFGLRYALATLTEQGWATRELSAQDAAALNAPSTLGVHWWWRWGLFVPLALIAFSIAMAIAGG